MKYLVSLLMVLSTLFVEAHGQIEKHLSESESNLLVQSVMYFVYGGADVKTLEIHRVFGEKFVTWFDAQVYEILTGDEVPYMPERRMARISALTTISMMVMPDSLSPIVQLRDEAMALCAKLNLFGSVKYHGLFYTDQNVLLDAIIHESENVSSLKLTLALIIDTCLKLSPDVPMYRVINKLSNDSKFQFLVKNKIPALLKSSKKN